MGYLEVDNSAVDNYRIFMNPVFIHMKAAESCQEV